MNLIFENALRVTYFGNCGTIYSIVWSNADDDIDIYELPVSPGEWVYPFEDEIICALIEDVMSMCGNAFLDNEDIFKVVVSTIELESISTTPN